MDVCCYVLSFGALMLQGQCGPRGVTKASYLERKVCLACVSCLFYDCPHMALCLLRPQLHHEGRWAFCSAAKYPPHAKWWRSVPELALCGRLLSDSCRKNCYLRQSAACLRFVSENCLIACSHLWIVCFPRHRWFCRCPSVVCN